MGAVLSFVEKAQEVMLEEDAEEMQKKVMSAKFEFNDLLKQTRSIAQMGSVSRVLWMIPGMVDSHGSPLIIAANTKIHEDGIKERRVLSDAEAAVVRQTVYRGYLVRKSEPLKKLRQIAEVSKEGLHPSLREIRQSLARELVTLQEKLDSIMLKKPPQQQMQELDAKKHLEISLQNVQNGEHNQEQQEEKVASRKNSSKGISDGKPQDQLCMMDVNGFKQWDPGVILEP